MALTQILAICGVPDPPDASFGRHPPWCRMPRTSLQIPCWWCWQKQ